MAHEITNTDNVVLSKVAAWHGLGTVVEEAPSIAGALMLAGLDWRVEQHDLTTTRGKMIETHTANVRSDTDDVLGIVGTGYTIFNVPYMAMPAEMLGHRGVGQLLDTVSDLQRTHNPRLRIVGILPTLYDGRSNHARAVLADVGERYAVPVLPPIPRSVRFAEAPALGRTVLTTASRSKGAAAYREVAAVVIEREGLPRRR